MVDAVKAAYLSFTEVDGDDAAHASHVAWHQLDHMPEQYAIPGIVAGHRWRSSPGCRAARAVASGDLARVQDLVVYLITDPVEETVERFYALYETLTAAGRMRESRGHLRGTFALAGTRVASRLATSPAVLPWRPATGVYVLVEDSAAEVAGLAAGLVEVPGVAGAWWFAATPVDPVITLLYLDADPLAVSAGLRPRLDARWSLTGPVPRFAGPFLPTLPLEEETA